MSGESATRLLTPAFVALTLSDLAYFTATGVLVAATPLFVTGPLGGGAVAVGMAMGAFSAATLLLRPFAGRWVDRYGRRGLLIAGALMFAVVAVGHYAVRDLLVLIGLRLLLGAAEAMFFVAGFAALADLAPPGRAGEALSMNSLALYVGVAVGPLLGQVLLARWGFPGAWMGAIGLALLATFAATRVPETGLGGHDGQPTPLLQRAAVVPGIGLFCGVAAMSGFLAFAVLHARAVGIERWSVVLLVFGSVVVLCRVVFAKLPDRVPPLRLAAVALLISVLGFLVIGSLRTGSGLMTGAVLLGVGTAFLTPAVFAAVFGVVPRAERGSAAATTSIFIDLGLSGGAMFMGVVAGATTIPVAFLIVAVLPASGGLLLLFRRRTAPGTH